MSKQDAARDARTYAQDRKATLDRAWSKTKNFFSRIKARVGRFGRWLKPKAKATALFPWRVVKGVGALLLLVVRWTLAIILALIAGMAVLLNMLINAVQWLTHTVLMGVATLAAVTSILLMGLHHLEVPTEDAGFDETAQVQTEQVETIADIQASYDAVENDIASKSYWFGRLYAARSISNGVLSREETWALCHKDLNSGERNLRRSEVKRGFNEQYARHGDAA